jgi:hypothetical protein
MNRFTHRIITPAIGGAVLLGSLNVSRAADPSYDELRKQVQQLQARLDQIEAQQAQPTAAAVDATVERVLRDADQRSKLLAVDGGFTAGYDKGFFIKSADDNYVLRPGLLFQFRGIANTRHDVDDTQSGFEVRRLRPRFDGNFITPDLTYSFVFDVNRNGGSTSLLDAFVQYRFAPQWAIKGGQFRESWFHEGDVPDSAQLTVERSMVDALLAGSQVDRVQGISLIYGGTKDDALRVEVMLHDGANSKNTDFRDVQPGATPSDPPVYSANFGTGARVEYKLFGDWANYKDFTAKGDKQDLLVFGGGYDWTQNGDTNVIRSTVDAQYENVNGWNVYGALNGVCTENDSNHRWDWGGLVQAGYLIRSAWEIFGRYDVVSLDSDYVSGESTFNELTFGVNYYLGENGSALHRAKFTLDLMYLPQGAPSNITGTDVLANSGDAEFVFRGQFQLFL